MVAAGCVRLIGLVRQRPVTTRRQEFKLLKKVETEKYQWRFNAYGQTMEAVDVSAVTEGTSEDRWLLERISEEVRTWTGADLGRIAAETGLPVITPQWSTVEAAIERVRKLAKAEIGAYQEMADDKLAIEVYAARLRPRAAVLSQTLCCVWALAAGSERSPEAEKFLHALRVVFEAFSIKDLNDDPAVRMGAIYRTLREALPALEERAPGLENSLDFWRDFTGRMIKTAKQLKPEDMRQRPWTRWFNRFDAYFQQGVTVFETAFEDLWTRIDPLPPAPWGKPLDLRPRLADVTLAAWGSMMLGSASPATPDSPPWLSLPAAIIPGLTRLANRIAAFALAPVLSVTEAPQFADWQRAVLAMRELKRASLLIASSTPSLASSWTVSTSYPVLYVEAAQFLSLVNWLTSLGVTRPQEIGMDRLFLELVGDAASLASFMRLAPASNLSVSNLPPVPGAAQPALHLPVAGASSRDPRQITLRLRSGPRRRRRPDEQTHLTPVATAGMTSRMGRLVAPPQLNGQAHEECSLNTCFSAHRNLSGGLAA
jgi:hypothetical protein